MEEIESMRCYLMISVDLVIYCSQIYWKNRVIDLVLLVILGFHGLE